ncbi:DUF1376 domain-containing protein [Methylobacterium sp. Leaf399]|uniref:DUF1376 domain-containing protein n=1 Tax=Methylobacterium sp. Leaf399 TaxID=1736364 RepID=UPI0009E979EA|nr:DUF1376 domain-containing protein [Methylobacterium sp. Leaf399]
MSKFPYLPLCVDAYRNDTPHLSLEEHGAYLTLIMLAWRSPGCRLPDDDVKLARMLGITAKKWAGLKPAIMAFWVSEGGFWTQGRLAKEHEYVSRKSDKNRAAGSEGGKAKSLKTKETGLANATANAIANALPPNTLHQTQEKKENPQDPGGSLAPKGAGGRGHRIPADFVSSDEAVAVCAEMGLRGEEAAEALAEFRDFWIGVPGAKGRKLDWPATLRNRLREIGRRRPSAGARAGPMNGRPPSSAESFLRLSAENHHILNGGDDDQGPFSGDVGPDAGAGGYGHRGGHAPRLAFDARDREFPPRRYPGPAGAH